MYLFWLLFYFAASLASTTEIKQEFERLDKECDEHVSGYLASKTQETKANLKQCLETLTNKYIAAVEKYTNEVSIRDIVPIDEANCEAKLKLLYQLMESAFPYYGQIIDQDDRFADTVDRLAKEVSYYLNSYTCLSYINMDRLMKRLDRAFLKYVSYLSPADDDVPTSKRHFFYLQNEVNLLLGTHVLEKAVEEINPDLSYEQLSKQMARLRFWDGQSDPITFANKIIKKMPAKTQFVVGELSKREISRANLFLSLPTTLKVTPQSLVPDAMSNQRHGAADKGMPNVIEVIKKQQEEPQIRITPMPKKNHDDL